MNTIGTYTYIFFEQTVRLENHPSGVQNRKAINITRTERTLYAERNTKMGNLGHRFNC